MSPICQSFVQNTWRKDLCSNCFKSKEEHGGGSYSCSQSSRREYSSEGPLAIRYLGVTGRTIYSRNYGGNSVNTASIHSPLDNKDTGFLKSPGLIHRMDSIIKQENEKNARLNKLKLAEDERRDDYCSDFVDAPLKSESWILSDLITDTKNFELTQDKIPKDKDCSSDLGSDASHDTSVSSSEHSGCSDLVSSGRSSSDLKEVDSDFVKSDTEEETPEMERIVSSILKCPNSIQKIRLNISFSESNEVIGFGGDVDYSDDDDDDYDDDDDDDDSSISSLDLPLDERELKYLTEKNTNLNSEIDNFEADKKIDANANSSPEDLKEDSTSKPEGRVKLKRCQPLVTTKPYLQRSTLPTTSFGELSEDIPMKGIKPKFVSREDEMREKRDDEFEELPVREKYTSIDDICPKVTSIDEYFSAEENLDGEDFETSKAALSRLSLEEEKEEEEEAKSSSREVEPNKGSKESSVKQDSLVRQLNAESNVQNVTQSSLPSGQVVKESQTSKKTTTNAPEITKPEHTQREFAKNYIKSGRPSNLLAKSSSDDSLDYTVRSAHPAIKMRCSQESLLKNEDPKDPPNRIQSAVVPLNMITIQRRNSFMESQLGGPVYMGNEATKTGPSNYKITSTKQSLSKTPAVLNDDAPRQDSQVSSQSVTTDSNGLIKTVASNVTSKTVESEETESQIPSSKCHSRPAVNLPQTSFLHTGGLKALQNSKTNTTVQLSEVPEFPARIATTSESPPFESSHYASTSILKNTPPKPATTPKPPFLKDRPKLSPKPSLDNFSIQTTSRAEKIYATPIISQTTSLKQCSTKDSMHSNSNVSPVTKSSTETVYDVPVTTTSPASTSATTTTSSSHYSAVPQTLNSKVQSSRFREPCREDEESNKEVPSHYRATFEANRSLLSSALNLGPVVSSCIKRQAPRPPVDGESEPPLSAQEQLGSETRQLTHYYDGQASSKCPGEPKTSATSQVDPPKGVTEENSRCEDTPPAIQKSFPISVDNQPSTMEAPNTISDLQGTSSPLEQKAISESDQAADLQNNLNEIRQASNFAEAALPNHLVEGSHVTNQVPAFDFRSPPQYENIDMESYSSFTDDFEDDDEGAPNDNEAASDVFVPLRESARSSSANPLNRMSVGPIIFCPTNSDNKNFDPNLEFGGKMRAVRSHSVPRSVEHSIFPLKTKHASSSKFSFVKSGFFRPSSPPSLKRKSSSERGRERVKRPNSGFSLKKLLKFGSSDKTLKASKLLKNMKEQDWDRETRKLKLQIIHPLDYNPNGVEVIARPEKTSPIYDYTGIYANTNFETNPSNEKDASKTFSFLQIYNGDSRSTDSPSPAPSSTVSSSNQSSSDIGTATGGIFNRKMKNDAPADSKKVEKKNSFLRKRRKPERKESITFGKPQASYVKQDRLQALSTNNIAQSATTTTSETFSNVPSSQLSTASSLVPISTHKALVGSSAEHVPPAAEAQSISIYPNGTLGFNSEGRPKPPPPPRKASLEASSASEGGSSHSSEAGDLPPSGRTFSASEINFTGARPHRPPPPRRTPSSAGVSHKETISRPGLRHFKSSSLYANLGEARVPITPLKPGRSCSVKDDEKEKRKAPNPPSQVPAAVETAAPMLLGSSNGAQLRPSKGPAPPTPTNPHLLRILNHEYEYIGDTPIKNGEKEKSRLPASSSSCSYDKTSQQSLAEPALESRSLEDQYGAVVHANLEALSNLLDQVCSQPESNSYKLIEGKEYSWSDVKLKSSDAVACGGRLFYEAKVADFAVLAMVTPEVKVDVDPLMMPSPIVCFKDEIPTHLLLRTKGSEKQPTTTGTVLLLPHMNLHSLEDFSHSSQRLLEQHPKQWERHVCLFLLQLVTALKHLQAKGIEETSLEFILVSKPPPQQSFSFKTSKSEQYPRLILVSNPQANHAPHHAVSLCHCAASATQLLLGHSNPIEGGMKGPILSPPFTPSPHAFSVLVATLREERATSLTRAKCLLESMLFGPSNLPPNSDSNLEASLQKWLDLERAKVMHAMVSDNSSKSNPSRSIWTKFQLFFLVRSSVKALREAIVSLQIPEVTNF